MNLNVQLEYWAVLHEGLLTLVLINGSETMVWRENETSNIRAKKMDKLIRRIERISNV